jgi:hypothetical protein
MRRKLAERRGLDNDSNRVELEVELGVQLGRPGPEHELVAAARLSLTATRAQDAADVAVRSHASLFQEAPDRGLHRVLLVTFGDESVDEVTHCETRVSFFYEAIENALV